MDIEQVRLYCLSKPLVTEDNAFGPDYINFRFFGKIFACINLERSRQVTLKCAPDYAVDLRDRYRGVLPAWHWNKAHWNDIIFDTDVPDALVSELIDHAYVQIVRSLPKKTLFNFPDLPEGWTHEHLSEVSSTMDYLRGISVVPGAFHLVTADFQTAGRGQCGTRWEAAARQNLLFGFRFSPEGVSAREQFLLSEVLAIAVARSLRKYLGEEVRIKWPNDVCFRHSKLCGMLLEHELRGDRIASTVTGIGINVNQRRFQGDAPNPASVFQLLGKEIDRAALLRNVLKSFMQYYRLLAGGEKEKVERDYAALLYGRNRLLSFTDACGTFAATVREVRADGTIVLVEADGREHEYTFKEVKFNLPAPSLQAAGE